jgi:hypothetical protein
MEIHAPRADFRQQRDDIDGRYDGSDRISERIAAAVGNSPESEGKLLLRFGSI